MLTNDIECDKVESAPISRAKSDMAYTYKGWSWKIGVVMLDNSKRKYTVCQIILHDYIRSTILIFVLFMILYNCCKDHLGGKNHWRSKLVNDIIWQMVRALRYPKMSKRYIFYKYSSV